MAQVFPWAQAPTWIGLAAFYRYFPIKVSFSLRTDYQDCDRESASNTAMAGYSLTGSVASSYLGHQRLEVGTFLGTGLTFGSVSVLDLHLDSIRLEQMFTRGKSSPSPVKDSARLSPSGSSFLDFVPSFNYFFPVKNQLQSLSRKMEQAQGRLLGVY